MSTDLGHTIILLAGNLALQTIYYLYFRSLQLQLEEHQRGADLTSQMTVEQAERYISQNVAKLIQI